MYVGHTETKIDWKLGWRWHVIFSIVLRTGFSEKNPHYCFAFVWWSPLDLQMYFLKADDYVLQGTKSQKSTSKNQEQKDLSNDKHEHKSERDWKKPASVMKILLRLTMMTLACWIIVWSCGMLTIKTINAYKEDSRNRIEVFGNGHNLNQMNS